MERKVRLVRQTVVSYYTANFKRLEVDKEEEEKAYLCAGSPFSFRASAPVSPGTSSLPASGVRGLDFGFRVWGFGVRGCGFRV